MRRPGWSPDEIERFIAAYEAGVPERELLAMFPGRTRNAFAGRIIRLQLKRPVRAGAKILAPTVPAVMEGRTLFPTRVREIAGAPAILVPGQWQRKLGGLVTKGAWAGMPIYSLTLEERATCPASCHHWRSCFAPGTRVLTADLQWKAIETLQIGERIAGFDEDPLPLTGRRLSRIAVVEGLGRSSKPSARIVTDKGVITASLDHLWLARNTRRGYRWIATDQLKAGDTIQFLNEPWDHDVSYDAGRVRGFVEGEGCAGAFGRKYPKPRIRWVQRRGQLLDEINAAVAACGFEFVVKERIAGVKKTKCCFVDLLGGWREALRFLGIFRPTRLMDQAEAMIAGHVLDGRGSEAARVLRVEPIGDNEVVEIATSTRTLVAEGFFTHNCMGNGMPLAWRHRQGPQLLERLRVELALLQSKHPGGFVVRLHVLGDFYSPEYAQAWRIWLLRFPALRVFGYTAWPPSSPIGRIIAETSQQLWDRFAIRLSSPASGPGRAITIWEWPTDLGRLKNHPKIIVCPAELRKTKGCGTCALCWSPAAKDLTIGFIAHGGKARPAADKSITNSHPLADVVAKHGSQRKAAAALGISLGKLQRGLRKAQFAGAAE